MSRRTGDFMFSAGKTLMVLAFCALSAAQISAPRLEGIVEGLSNQIKLSYGSVTNLTTFSP
jgi:hypothetical protein